MDQIAADYSETQEIHIVMDNYRIHKKCDECVAEHQNLSFHYTPTSASWLNMVEILFGVLSRKAIKGGNFKGCEELPMAIG
ncbi:MAG: transposase [Deltaproteobacteria bacterium]|jgi:transposase|nr:transposase [Deltaproteobacteria bacterium]